MLWLQKTDGNAIQTNLPNIASIFHRRKTKGKIGGGDASKALEIKSKAEHVPGHREPKSPLAFGIAARVRRIDGSLSIDESPSPTSSISTAGSAQPFTPRRQHEERLRPRRHRASVTSTFSATSDGASCTTGGSAFSSPRDPKFVAATAQNDLSWLNTPTVVSQDSRESHATMLAAFDAALTKDRSQKLLETLPCGASEGLSSSGTESQNMDPSQTVSHPHVQAASDRPVFGRQRSLSMRILNQRPTTVTSHDYFSSAPLPPLPTQSHMTALRKYKFQLHSKAIKRNELYIQTTQRDNKELDRINHRRSSCPQIHSPTEIKESQDVAKPTEDLLFAAFCTIRWLFNGRQFCGPGVADILKKSGAKCLSLEQSIMDFARDFPNATEVLFESSSAPGSTPDQAKFSSLPYEDNTFDVIHGRALSTSIMSRHWTTTLAELKRVLRPGGRLELVEFASEWLNAGPLTNAYEQSLSQAYQKLGLETNVMDNIPKFVHQSSFVDVKVSYLAVPIHWGGSCSRLWVHNIEPLAAAYEASLLGQPVESRHRQWKDLETEIISHRSLKVIVAVSATK